MLLGGFVGLICGFALLYFMVFLIVVSVAFMIWGKLPAGEYRRLSIFRRVL